MRVDTWGRRKSNLVLRLICMPAHFSGGVHQTRRHQSTLTRLFGLAFAVLKAFYCWQPVEPTRQVFTADRVVRAGGVLSVSVLRNVIFAMNVRTHGSIRTPLAFFLVYTANDASTTPTKGRGPESVLLRGPCRAKAPPDSIALLDISTDESYYYIILGSVCGMAVRVSCCCSRGAIKSAFFYTSRARVPLLKKTVCHQATSLSTNYVARVFKARE